MTLREERRLRVFENRVLSRIFGPNRDEVEECGKLRNEKLYYLYSSPKGIRMMKSRRMKWTGHVARLGRGEVHTGYRCGNLRDRDNLEDPSVVWRIILRCIFRKCDGGRGMY
jgi:hypothetical protein